MPGDADGVPCDTDDVSGAGDHMHAGGNAVSGDADAVPSGTDDVPGA